MLILDGEFTAESVADGHPDKICDQIADALLDACLRQDPLSRVAIECLMKGHHVVLAGEITTKATHDIESIVKTTLARIGHGDGRWGIDLAALRITALLTLQSSEIGAAVDHDAATGLGAGDQGTVFGYAAAETPEHMPAAIWIAHALMRRHREVRLGEALGLLGPDAKAQVTLRYANGKPLSIATLVISTQHSADLQSEQVKDLVRNLIIAPELEHIGLRAETILINPGGAFTVGGPLADAGVTGRKIIVDTYGGQGRHGGGAFSGKDPTKVDRSGAYGARQLAKTIVAAGLASHCEVRASYAIGHIAPLSVAFDTFGTGSLKGVLAAFAEHDLDPHGLLTPSSLASRLGLNNAIYADLAAFGHFGRECSPWEKVLFNKRQRS
jgi:S-adenosylmethionine synthetase